MTERGVTMRSKPLPVVSRLAPSVVETILAAEGGVVEEGKKETLGTSEGVKVVQGVLPISLPQHAIPIECILENKVPRLQEVFGEVQKESCSNGLLESSADLSTRARSAANPSQSAAVQSFQSTLNSFPSVAESPRDQPPRVEEWLSPPKSKKVPLGEDRGGVDITKSTHSTPPKFKLTLPTSSFSLVAKAVTSESRDSIRSFLPLLPLSNSSDSCPPPPPSLLPRAISSSDLDEGDIFSLLRSSSDEEEYEGGVLEQPKKKRKRERRERRERKKAEEKEDKKVGKKKKTNTNADDNSSSECDTEVRMFLKDGYTDEFAKELAEELANESLKNKNDYVHSSDNDSVTMSLKDSMSLNDSMTFDHSLSLNDCVPFDTSLFPALPPELEYVSAPHGRLFDVEESNAREANRTTDYGRCRNLLNNVLKWVNHMLPGLDRKAHVEAAQLVFCASLPMTRMQERRRKEGKEEKQYVKRMYISSSKKI